MNRSAAREETFKVLYSLEIQKKETIDEQLDLYMQSEQIEDNGTVSYISSTIKGIYNNINVIEEKISLNL